MIGIGKPRFINILQEFSIPLLAGVVVAMLSANLAPEWYEQALRWKPFGDGTLLGHEITLHFLVNDVFMVFFFGIAAKEITEACLPGGDLNPPARAVNPLLATLGGVVGPVLFFFLGLTLLFQGGVYTAPSDDWSALQRGWAVPTATDIALAWLVARAVFGKGHPAINFLLLIAVADDAIGLVIIAVFYGDPVQPARPEFLGLVGVAMAVALALRRLGVNRWVPYVAISGPLSWLGLSLAHMHPALALVPIVPFLPPPRRDVGFFLDMDEVDQMGEELARDLHIEHSALYKFGHQLRGLIDFGLFFFAFANAGVALADIGWLTWLILGSLVAGKTLGIVTLGWLASRAGFPLPDRMGLRELSMAGFVAALGLTVALFLAGAAFTDARLLGQAKMGALLSGFVGLLAIGVGRALGMARRPAGAPPGSEAEGEPVGRRGAPSD